jgi:hypothetical protein
MKNKIIYFSIFLVLLSSCGTTVITFSEHSRPYSVYINNNYKGLTSSKIKIPQSGLPEKKEIKVKDGFGRVVGKESIKRKFNPVIFILGCFYLYPLWLFSWEYDRKVEVHINQTQSKSAWDEDEKKSPWD